MGSREGPERSLGPWRSSEAGAVLGVPGGARGSREDRAWGPGRAPGRQAGRVREELGTRAGAGEGLRLPGPGLAVSAQGRARSVGGPGEGTGCGRGLVRRHRDGCAAPRRTLTEAPGHEGPGRAGDSRGRGRPGAKAARGGGRERAQTSDPAPPLTRFSSSASASGARAAAATTSHCLFSEPQARAPRLPSAPPGPPRHGRRGLLLAAAAATLQLLWRSRLSHWPSRALASPPAPTKPRQCPHRTPPRPRCPSAPPMAAVGSRRCPSRAAMETYPRPRPAGGSLIG